MLVGRQGGEIEPGLDVIEVGDNHTVVARSVVVYWMAWAGEN